MCIYTYKCLRVCVYVHVLCGARGGGGSSKLMLQGLIVAKVQFVLLASCQAMHRVTKLQ